MSGKCLLLKPVYPKPSLSQSDSSYSTLLIIKVPKPPPPPVIPEQTTWIKKFILRNRRLVGIMIPCLFLHFVWWSVCIRHNYFVEFVKRYRLSIITIFGATSGGITSIGGGVIAFPVMTLGFTIPPIIARDFCIMCQAVGELDGGSWDALITGMGVAKNKTVKVVWPFRHKLRSIVVQLWIH